jgi:drug/metabolite transporter (DMT)-like permease
MVAKGSKEAMASRGAGPSGGQDDDREPTEKGTDMRVIYAFIFLVFVAVTKTLLTKNVFVHVPTPVAFSVLSCFVTAVCLIPVFMWMPQLWTGLTGRMAVGFLGVCIAIAIDLAATNVAISLLSVALQQCIKATSPAATIFVESLWNCTCRHPVLYLVVALLCIGPILTNLGSTSYDSTPLGVGMMVFAVIAGAFKYVLAHSIIKQYKNQMGTLAFTFWVEIFVGFMLIPWAYFNGELQLLFWGDAVQTTSDWLLLCFTAAYGGVRIYSQFALLEFTSATTLAISNIVIQALTIILGIFLFGTEVTNYLIAGVSFTLLTSCLYTYLSVSKVLERTDWLTGQRVLH